MRALDLALDPESAFAALRSEGRPSLLFDGRGGHDASWPCRLAIDPRVSFEARAPAADPVTALARLDALVARRRAAGGPGGTGVAMLCTYEAWALSVLEVDAFVGFPPGGAPEAVGPPEAVARAVAAFARSAPRDLKEDARTRVSGRPRTSLGRAAYLSAVSRVKRHIAAGDIYQANLTQCFEAPFEGDPWDLYTTIAASTPAPRSAYVELPGLALASFSPEMFVDASAFGVIETRPIKGTRPRGATPDADARAAEQLLASAKDRAELVMIVDVLRNDLGKIARIGSVNVPELAALRSYAAVHHLVARIVAEKRDEVTVGELVAAVFPGGSITGAPKQRAIELLSAIEPCPRGLYTGCLFWFDDDGSLASSILIRSAVVTGGRVSIGAGGGIVADSDPEAEWAEANAKARALTQALG